MGVQNKMLRIVGVVGAVSEARKLSFSRARNFSSKIKAEFHHDEASLAALANVNKLMLKTSEEKIQKESECDEIERKITSELKQVDILIESSQTKSARMTSELLEAHSSKAEKERALSKLSEEAADARVSCEQVEHRFKEELKNVMSDAEVAKEVLKASCPDKVKLVQTLKQTGSTVKTQETNLTIKKCTFDTSRTFVDTSKTAKATTAIMDGKAGKVVSKISTTRLSLLHTGMMKSKRSKFLKVSPMKTEMNDSKSLMRHSHSHHEVSVTTTDTSISFIELSHQHLQQKIEAIRTKEGKAMVHRSLGRLMSVDKEGKQEPVSRPCTPSIKPSCGHFESAMTSLFELGASSISEKREQLESNQKECKAQQESRALLSSQFRDELSSINARVAHLTSEVSQAKSELELEVKERKNLLGELSQSRDSCQSILASQSDGLCRLKKVRSELMSMKSIQGIPQDCELTGYRGDKSSCQCGKEMSYHLIREIVSPNNALGMPCPMQLGKDASCPPCPKDCEMSEWSAWTECSSSCGAGVKRRMRQIVSEPENGGRACLSTNDMDSCVANGGGASSAGCNQNCELSEWTGWDTCSQKCGTGLQLRVRNVMKSAEGIGSCPAEESRARRQIKTCVNLDKEGKIEPCSNIVKDDQGKETEQGEAKKCSEAKIDLVILVDNSGESNLLQNKEAVKKLVKGLEMGAEKVSVSLVSVAGMSFMDTTSNGPLNGGLVAISKTTAGKDDVAKDDPSSKCLLQWSLDNGAVTKAVDAIPQGVGPFSIYKGLSVALNLFNAPGARADAKAQLVVVSNSNVLEDYNQLSLLGTENFSPSMAQFVKVGGMESKNAKTWKKISTVLNRKNAKATINRTLYNVSSYDKVDSVFREQLLPSMCGEGYV